MSTLEERLKAMFIEDTGIHFMDSGDADGRAWQMNRKNHPCDKPEVRFDEGEYYVNAYKYMLKALDTDPFCDSFNTLEDDREHLHEDDYSDRMEGLRMARDLNTEAYDLLESRLKKIDTPVYYTYNEESDLDHDMLVAYLTAEDDAGYDTDYVLISLHLGADARGGFGTPYLFMINHNHEFTTNPYVYGTVTRDGTDRNVSNIYNGYHLDYDADDGSCEERYEYRDGDEVELWVCE